MTEKEQVLINENSFREKWESHPPLRNALLAAFTIGLGFILFHSGNVSEQVEILLFSVGIILGGYHWVREGLEELYEEKKMGIEILMIAATIGAIILGIWDEAAFLVVLYGAAEGVEEYAYEKTRTSINKLLDLVPDTARVIRDGTESMIPAIDLTIGDIVFIKPGESIPTDGVIRKGSSSINEAAITGESIPVEKTIGVQAFAGTINGEGALEIEVTTTFENNTLSKIIHLVEEAQEQKGNAQLFIEKFGSRYTPVVLLGAVLLFVIPVFLGGDVAEWALRAVVLLIAAAPCALIMSTPIAVAAGIGSAGRKGVLIKGGIHLENLGKVRMIALDKTGTLTHGKPVVTDIVALTSSESELMRMAYSVERFSEHPLAKAIVERAREDELQPLEATEFKALTGAGVRAKISDDVVYVGKIELFQTLRTELPDFSNVETLENEGKTVVYVGTLQNIIGIIAINDDIRPKSQDFINELRRLSIGAVMVTGDNKRTAKRIATELGIENVKADLKPADKVEVIKQLEKEYGAVAMVGDGINDAPALASATVGIAMGTGGTDAAIEAADVALVGDDLLSICFAIDLGKRARQISRQNIAFSLLVLALLIPTAIVGILGPALAVAFHEASELLAVGNGLRVAKK